MRAVFLLLLTPVLLLPATATAFAAPIRVILDEGDTLRATSIKPASFQTLAVTLEDSSIRHIPSARVRTVLDSEDRDRTSLVLEDRRSLPLSPAEARQLTLDKSERHHTICWRGQPRAYCGGFVLTEFGALVRLDEYPYRGSDSRLAFTFDLGYMKNISDREAVGLTGYALLSDPTTRLGVRARYRRWIKRRLSVDVTPGIILGGEDNAIEYAPPGFVLGAAINAGDLFSVTVDAEYARNRDLVHDTPPLEWNDRSDVAWRAGARLGSGLGLLGAAGLFGLILYIGLSGGFD